MRQSVEHVERALVALAGIIVAVILAVQVGRFALALLFGFQEVANTLAGLP